MYHSLVTCKMVLLNLISFYIIFDLDCFMRIFISCECDCPQIILDLEILIKGSFLLQAWNLYEKGELEELVDISLNGDVNIEEACRYLKIGLLCTQDMPKLRPAMSTVVEMLTGQIDVDDKIISKPGLFSEFVDQKDDGGNKDKVNTKDTVETESGGTGKLSSSSSGNITTSFATMTFNSIYDRSN